jgi:hypothetical protein
MPKLRCNCGEVIHYGQIPCPSEWLIISDSDFDKFSGMMDAEEIYSATKSFLLCPKCRRLWVFWNGYGHSPEEFIPSSLPPPL